MELLSLRKIYRTCPWHRGPGPPVPAHRSTDFIKRRSLAFGLMARIESCEPVSLLGCLDPIRCWVAIGSSQSMQESPSADLMVEATGSDRGWRRLVLAAACHGQVRWLTGVCVFSSYDGQFLMRFAPTESQRRGERVYANLNRRRVAMKPGNGEAARPVLVDSEGGLRWSFSSKDVCQSFLELPYSFSTDQLLRSVGSWLATENSHYIGRYIGVFRQDRSRQGLQHLRSLHRTLSREDSEENEKGINAVSNNRLNEYDNGFGSG
jgi:hypothetical protein